jgi:general secretion pathway protein D/MSHA biogenesis protein MshL
MTRFAYSLMAKRFSMKLKSQVAPALALFLLSLVLLSCSPLTAEPEEPTAEAAKSAIQEAMPPSLPVQYQKPSYLVDTVDSLDSQTDDVVLKVGAKISSGKKIPLRDIMKPLASQKKLNISWASDVNQDALVDVDIKADDDFYKSIENLLRQVDYFYEIQGSTLVIKYRETKKFQVAMPFSRQEFSTGTGGDVLGGEIEGQAKNNIEGTIKILSEKNEFDIWKNIEEHMESILKIERTVAISTLEADGATTDAAAGKNEINTNTITKKETKTTTGGLENYYLIDKPVGLITVTAPRPILDKVEAYFTSLRKEIYKQISIEAKIIEVQLIDSSAIGINWTQVLENFNIAGAVEFGAHSLTNGVTSFGQIFPYVFSNENDTDGKWNDGTNHGSTYDPTRLVSNVRINTANFDVFLNALKTQGNTKILSNPKISVLNGQPAMISVGRNVSYVKQVDSVVTAGANGNTVTYTAKAGSILSGVGLGLTATVLDNNEIIMNLVPVTSELEEGSQEAVIVAGQGSTSISMGLPIVNVREMSTTVRVKDGEMLVIGGLISDMNTEEGNFAPVLGDIPLIKYLFGHEEKVKNKRELIILLKPRII